MALVVEDRQLVSAFLMEQGIKVQYYNHRTINKGSSHKEMHEIKQNKYVLIAVEAPKPRMHLSVGAISACWGTLCTWASLAHDLHIPMAIMGPTGQHWKHDYVATLERDGIFQERGHCQSSSLVLITINIDIVDIARPI